MFQAVSPIRACAFLGFGDDSESGGIWVEGGFVWLGLVEKCRYSEILAGIPLFWAVAPVRARASSVFAGCLGIWKGMG